MGKDLFRDGYLGRAVCTVLQRFCQGPWVRNGPSTQSGPGITTTWVLTAWILDDERVPNAAIFVQIVGTHLTFLSLLTIEGGEPVIGRRN
jgi:hypothetical protein